MGKTTGIDVAIDKYMIKKFVNKENGTVTLKTTVEGCVISHFFRDICNQLRFNKRLSIRLIGYIHITTPHELIVVTVKCRPEDKFNEDVGASKAFRKLKGEVRKYIIRALFAMYDDCIDAITNVHDLYTDGKLQTKKDLSIKDVLRLFYIMDKKTEPDFHDEEDWDE